MGAHVTAGILLNKHALRRYVKSEQLLKVYVGELMRCLDIQGIPENLSPNPKPLEIFLEISGLEFL